MPKEKKQLKLTECKGWVLKDKKPSKKFTSLLDLPSFVHLNLQQVEKLKEYIYR